MNIDDNTIAEILSRLSRLPAIEEAIADLTDIVKAEAEASAELDKRRKRNAKRMRLVRARSSVHAQKENEKENEKEERESPPYNPSIEKEEKVKEKEKEFLRNSLSSSSRASESEKEKNQVQIQDSPIPKPPTFEEALAWAQEHDRYNYTESIVREWWKERDFIGWRDKNGKPIANWQYDLQSWKTYLPIRKKNADPDRIPDARNRDKDSHRIKCTVRASNWRGTRPEDIQHVF